MGLQVREDVMSEGVLRLEANGDLVSAESSLTARRRRSAMVCLGGVSGFLLFIISTCDRIVVELTDRWECRCKW